MINNDEQHPSHLTPSQVIEQMIQLRTQLAQLSQQIQELEPSFSASLCYSQYRENYTTPSYYLPSPYSWPMALFP
ncbi:MAG: hypothetical protein AB4372_36885 [Xenococcus sp. (in: cyanobacteria)]